MALHKKNMSKDKLYLSCCHCMLMLNDDPWQFMYVYIKTVINMTVNLKVRGQQIIDL